MVPRTVRVLVVGALAALGGSGVAACARPGGAATTLRGILDGMGVPVVAQSLDESFARRDGAIVAAFDRSVHERIIASFGLRRYGDDDPGRSLVLVRLPEGTRVKEVWGVSGRPPQLRAAGGVQLESLVVVLTEDDRMILLTEQSFS